MPIPNNQHDLTEYYRTQAAIFDSVRSPILDSYEEKIRLIIEEGRITRDMDIVEIGSGTGKYLSRIVADTGARGIGVEKSAHMFSMAKAACSDKVKYINADATRMPLESDSVDVCYAVNSIHQINDKNTLFGEVFRVLRPNGKFLIVTPNVQRLDEFLLYKACPILLEFELNRLPTVQFVKDIGKFNGLCLLKEVQVQSNSCVSVPLDEISFLVNNRFLSCLSNLTDSELDDIITRIMTFSNLNSISGISPYAYNIICLYKGDF